jgi:hypothetical protein
MNNSSSSSSKNNDEKNKPNENTDDILDIMFDYTGNGDDELTLRFENIIAKNQTNSFFFFCKDVVVNWKFYQKMNRYQVHVDGGLEDLLILNQLVYSRLTLLRTLNQIYVLLIIMIYK